MNPNSPADPKLKRSLLFAFSLPAIMLGFTHGPESIVQGLYAKYGGIPLTALAAAMLLTRMFDAVTYPLIGFLSDFTFRKTGSRKHWLAAGTAVMVPGLWFLYHPPHDVTVTWYGIWMAVTYFGWKLSEIPYAAWAVSLSRDYVQRARVQIWRAMAQLSGGLVFFTMPYFGQALGLAATTEMTLQTMHFTALVIVVCVPLLNLYALMQVPDGEATPTEAAKTHGWRDFMHTLLHNRPLLHLLAAYIPISFVSGMGAGVNFLFFDTYLQLGKQFALISIIALPCTLLGLPFWGWLCMHYERHKVWAVATLIGATGYLGMSFAPIGQSGFILVTALNSLALFCIIAMGVALQAIIGDIADYDQLQSGENRAGLFTATQLFVAKSLLGVTAALGVAVTGWFGFDPKATVQTASGVFGMKLVMIWLQSAGFILGGLVIWHFPLNRARMAEIRAALAARGAGNGAPTAAVTG